MKGIFSKVLYLVLLTLAGVAHASSRADTTDATDRVLAAMDRTPTDGHPDQFNEFAGMHRYTAGDYPKAMQYFLVSARYADKLSQLSIGLMYLNGQGVAKDPVTAFAWIAIAAERKYPQFLATRDGVWAQLDAKQRQQATTLVESLYAEYGDTFAKPRMEAALRRGLSDETGTGLGYDHSGNVSSLTAKQFENRGEPSCNAETIDGAQMTGCGDVYAASRWDPKKYFQSRDSAWSTGTVTVGALQDLTKTQAAPKSSDENKSNP